MENLSGKILGRKWGSLLGSALFKCVVFAVAMSWAADLHAVVVRAASARGAAVVSVRGGMAHRVARNRVVAFHHQDPRFFHQRFFDHRRMFAHRRFNNNNLIFIGGGSVAYPYSYPSAYGYGQQYYNVPMNYSDYSAYSDYPASTPYSYDRGGFSGSVRGSVREVQSKLAQLGYYQGAIDGSMGPLTREAVNGYQHDYNLAVTGTITSGLLARLNLQ